MNSNQNNEVKQPLVQVMGQPMMDPNSMYKVFTNVTSDNKYIYSVFHTIMIFIALYLSFRCKGIGKYSPLEILAAFCCPYFYIMYILAYYGTCNILPGESDK